MNPLPNTVILVFEWPYNKNVVVWIVLLQIIVYYSALQKNSFFLAIPYVNEVTLMLLASWFLMCFFKKFRCLNAENLGSVD